MFDKITNSEMDTLEEFFRRHDAPIFHEVSPLADASLLALLNERGYQPCELTSVMFQEFGGENSLALSLNENLKTRVIETGEDEIWAQTSANGWATEMEGLADF